MLQSNLQSTGAGSPVSKPTTRELELASFRKDVDLCAEQARIHLENGALWHAKVWAMWAWRRAHSIYRRTHTKEEYAWLKEARRKK